MYGAIWGTIFITLLLILTGITPIINWKFAETLLWEKDQILMKSNRIMNLLNTIGIVKNCRTYVSR